MYSTVPSVEPPSITMISSTQSRRSWGTITRTASISLSVGNSSVVVSFTRHPFSPPPFPPPHKRVYARLGCATRGRVREGAVREVPVIGQFQALRNPDLGAPAQLCG